MTYEPSQIVDIFVIIQYSAYCQKQEHKESILCALKLTWLYNSYRIQDLVDYSLKYLNQSLQRHMLLLSSDKITIYSSFYMLFRTFLHSSLAWLVKYIYNVVYQWGIVVCTVIVKQYTRNEALFLFLWLFCGYIGSFGKFVQWKIETQKI